jgi:hypothetical protein
MLALDCGRFLADAQSDALIVLLMLQGDPSLVLGMTFIFRVLGEEARDLLIYWHKAFHGIIFLVVKQYFALRALSFL